MSEREPTIGDVLAEMKDLRATLMARMDRLQAMLELLGAQQQSTQQTTETAQAVSKVVQSTASIATDLLKRGQQLVAALRARLRRDT